MPDIYLRPGAANPSDITLRDPTSAGGVTAYSLSAGAGAFALSGQDVALSRGRLLALEVGAFSLVGQDATLTVVAGSIALTLSAEAGAFTVSGQAAALSRTGASAQQSGGGRRRARAPRSESPYFAPRQQYVLHAATAYVAPIGQDAILRRGFTLGTEAGAFELEGGDSTGMDPRRIHDMEILELLLLEAA